MSRPPVLDREQVRQMAGIGFPADLAAARLGCSPRHYRRLCEALGCFSYEDPDPLLGTDDEVILWRSWRELGCSYREIAYAYGLSHETIRAALSEAYQPAAPL